MSAEKIVVDSLIHDLMVRPGDFYCDRHTLKDKKNNVEYWVANTFSDAGIYTPYRLSFGFIQGWRFHSALKKWKAHRILNPVSQQ